MEEIRVFVHDGSIYLEPYHVLEKEVDKTIQEWRESHLDYAEKENQDHFVYAVKTFSQKNELVKVDLYSTALNEKEFSKRINALEEIAKMDGNTVFVGAWHKGTSYKGFSSWPNGPEIPKDLPFLTESVYRRLSQIDRETITIDYVIEAFRDMNDGYDDWWIRNLRTEQEEIKFVRLLLDELQQYGIKDVINDVFENYNFEYKEGRVVVTEQKKEKLVLEHIGFNCYDYPLYKDQFNKCWLDVNFGREPIQLAKSSSNDLEYNDGEPDAPISDKYEVEFTSKYVKSPRAYDYQLLDRLRSDCQYYINCNGKTGSLWADVPTMLEKMEEIMNSFKEAEKPEWLTSEEFEKLKEEALKIYDSNNSEQLVNNEEQQKTTIKRKAR